MIYFVNDYLMKLFKTLRQTLFNLSLQNIANRVHPKVSLTVHVFLSFLLTVYSTYHLRQRTRHQCLLLQVACSAGQQPEDKNC